MKTPEQMAEDILHGVGKVASELWRDDEQAKKFAEVIRGTWLAGYQAAERQWISVKDRLPEECQEILWYHATGGEYCVGQLIDTITPPFFTHWMPLPEAPKED